MPSPSASTSVLYLENEGSVDPCKSDNGFPAKPYPKLPLSQWPEIVLGNKGSYEADQAFV